MHQVRTAAWLVILLNILLMQCCLRRCLCQLAEETAHGRV